MTQNDMHNLPYCVYSADCLRWLDALVTPDLLTEGAVEAFGLEEQEIVQLRQLSIHLPACPTCTRVVANARLRRDQQRAALKVLLEAGGQAVPSTKDRILSVIRQEARTQAELPHEQLNGQQHLPYQLPVSRGPRVSSRAPSHQPRQRTRSRYLPNSLAVAAVVLLVLASIGLFSRQFFQSSSMSSDFPSQGWDAVALIRQDATTSTDGSNQTVLSNYDITSGRQQMQHVISNVSAVEEAIPSPDGLNILYSVMDPHGKLSFTTLLSEPAGSVLYSRSDGQPARALWLDNQTILFITSDRGIFTRDVRSGHEQILLAHPHIVPLNPLFYQAGYLYYEDSSNAGVTGILMRMQLSTGDVQRLSQCSDGRTFQLRSDGSTVAYQCMNSGNIYEVNVDGSNLHLIHTQPDETLIGYAPDDSLLVLAPTNGKTALKRFKGSDPQEKTVVQDITPDALFVHADNIYVAPDGHAMVVVGASKDGEYKAWLVNLNEAQQGQVRGLAAVASNSTLIFAGWNKLTNNKKTSPSVSPTVPVNGLPTSTPVNMPTLTLTPFSSSQDWNAVTIASLHGNQYVVSAYNYQSGHNVTLAQAGADAEFDGISSDGQGFIYRASLLDFPSQVAYHFILPGTPDTVFFTQPGVTSASSNALWLPDNRHVLVTLSDGTIVKLDTRVHAQDQKPQVLLKMANAGLKFYRDGYLYFVGSGNLVQGALYRISLSGGAPPQKLTESELNTTYWLSPDGQTIYYTNTSSAGSPGIMQVNSDGSNLHLLRSNGIPVGFGVNDALVIVRQVNNVFDLIQLGSAPGQDQILKHDLTAGSGSFCAGSVNVGVVPICDSNLALSPYASGLIAQVFYADGSSKIFAYDLNSGHMQKLDVAASYLTRPPQLLGWNTLPVH